MKDYYVAQVNVIINGSKSVIVPISGQGYNPNYVKSSAIAKVKESHDGGAFTAVILSTESYDLEEYKKIIGRTPPWLEP